MKKLLNILKKIRQATFLVLAIMAALLIVMLDKKTNYSKFRDKTR